MKNPFRDEAAAFRLVVLSLGYFGLIAVAAWISTVLGIVVFVVLTAIALLALRGGRSRPEPRVVEKAVVDDTRRVLVVANETVGGQELLEIVRQRAALAGTAVHVVCPALNSRVRTWTSDEDGARSAAQARLDASLARLAGAGIAARGEIGDGDPVQAIEDVLRSFPADEIVLSTHPPGRSNWLERGVVGAVRDQFDVPVTHVVVDLERQG